MISYLRKFFLTLHFAISKNGQTHFKNLASNAARFLKCVWPFYNIAKMQSKGLTKKKKAFRGLIKYFEWAPPELGQLGDSKRTIF